MNASSPGKLLTTLVSCWPPQNPSQKREAAARGTTCERKGSAWSSNAGFSRVSPTAAFTSQRSERAANPRTAGDFSAPGFPIWLSFSLRRFPTSAHVTATAKTCCSRQQKKLDLIHNSLPRPPATAALPGHCRLPHILMWAPLEAGLLG